MSESARSTARVDRLFRRRVFHNLRQGLVGLRHWQLGLKCVRLLGSARRLGAARLRHLSSVVNDGRELGHCDVFHALLPIVSTHDSLDCFVGDGRVEVLFELHHQFHKVQLICTQVSKRSLGVDIGAIDAQQFGGDLAYLIYR